MHTPEELDEFQRGETRHLFAAYKDGRSGLYFLEPGTALVMRDYAKEFLRCAVASCVSPDLTTAGPTNRRHGFRHLHAPELNHGRESEFHIAAKGLIERWAAAQDATVEARSEQDPDGTHQRRSDVLVTWPDGSRLAFEPQYSSIPLPNWQVRHTWYSERAIPDVWLFGHNGHQLRASGAAGLIKLNHVQMETARTHPVLWINPNQELIATIDIGGVKRWNGREAIRGRLLIVPLADCTLTRRGLEHPEIDRCHSLVTALIAAAERPDPSRIVDEFGWVETAPTRDESESLRQDRAWNSGRRAQGPRGLRQPATSDSREPWEARTPREKAFAWADMAEARTTAGSAGREWLNTSEGRAVISKVGHERVTAPFPLVLPLPTHQWQMFIYDKFVLGCPVGVRIDVASVTAGLLRHFAGQELPYTCELDPELVKDRVEQWFQHAASVLVNRLGPYSFGGMG